MRKIIYILILLLVITAGFVSCGGSLGGVEAGNPPDATRQVTGQVASASQSLSNRFLTSSDCPVDGVVAVDTLAQTTSASFDGTCTFTLNLTVNKAYALNFYLDDSFVAAMIFNNGVNQPASSVTIISSGTSAIDLGLITLNGEEATPEYEPAEQNDQDEDGVSDYEDEDDDDDSIEDSGEDDCDSDGIPDDYDEDSCEEDTHIEDNSTEDSAVEVDSSGDESEI